MSTIKDDAVETVLRQAKIRGRQLRRRRRVLSMSLVSALVLGTSGIAGLVATAGRTPRSNVPPTSVRPAGTSSTVQMPNVLGMTTAVAEQAISAATSPSGVTVQVTVQNLTADEIANLPPSAAGTVVAQVPSMGGVIDSQSEIILRVDDPSSPGATSAPPTSTSSTVQMPDVLGMTTAVAQQAISAATSPSGVTVQVTVQNLTADEIANPPPSAAGTVVAQVPSMGGVIDSQSEIVLRVDDPSSPS